MIRLGGKQGTTRQVVYARREPTKDPDLPPRTFAKDVVLSRDQAFTTELRRYLWNDPERPTRRSKSGNVFLRIDGDLCRIVWAPDVAGDRES